MESTGYYFNMSDCSTSSGGLPGGALVACENTSGLTSVQCAWSDTASDVPRYNCSLTLRDGTARVIYNKVDNACVVAVGPAGWGVKFACGP